MNAISSRQLIVESLKLGAKKAEKLNGHIRSYSTDQKTGRQRERFLMIPNADLHPDLKLPAYHIKFQNFARIGGTLLYPLASICGLSFAYLWAPVCVGTHHASMRFAYQAALEILKSGDITHNPESNHEIKATLNTGKITRFHFNWKGDLWLHLDAPNTFCLARFKGIAFSEKPTENPLSHKINSLIGQIFPHSGSQFSYFHLEEDVQCQVDIILRARQLRFRTCMGTVLVASILGKCRDILDNDLPAMLFDLPSFGIYIAMGISINAQSFANCRVSKHTQELWYIIRQKGDLINLIKPQYRGYYAKGDFRRDGYLCLSTFGNIRYSFQKPVSLRQTHRWQLHKKD